VAVGKVWVGIDVDKGFHHACVVDETGGVVFSRKVANGQAAIEQLIARTNAKAGEVVWAVDMTSGVACLLARRLVDVIWALMRDNRSFTGAPALVSPAA
jgi:hypothetical protein